MFLRIKLLILVLGVFQIVGFSNGQSPEENLLKTIQLDDAVLAIDLSQDNKLLASAGASNNVELWNIEESKKIMTFEGHSDDVVAVRISPNGRFIASGSVDKRVIIWDIVSGSIVHELLSHSDYVRDVAFSSDSKKLVSASWDGTAIVWDVVTGRQIQTFTGHRDNVTSAAFNNDGTQVITSCGDHNVRVWDASNGRLVKEIRGHTDEIWNVKWANNNKYAASGGWDNTARVWNVETGEQLYKLPGHVTDVWSVSFDPLNQTLATCGGDRKVKLWDLATGKLLLDVSGKIHKSDVEEVVFSNDGRFIVSCSRDGSIRFWKAPTLEERIKLLTEQRMEVWEQQREFEKTKDYEARLAKRQKFFDIEKNKVIEEIGAFYVESTDWRSGMTISKYNSDAEYFIVQSPLLGEMRLNVRISEAPAFKENFDKIVFKDLKVRYEKGEFKTKSALAHWKEKNKYYEATVLK